MIDEPRPEVSAAELSRAVLRNSALMIVSRSVGLLTLMLAVPVVIARLGPEGFGVWETLMAIATSVAILEMVVAGTLMWRISMSYASEDVGETRRMVRLGVAATWALLVPVVAAAWATRDGLLVWLQVPPPWFAAARWVLPAIVAVVILGGVNEVLIAAITGHQRAGRASLMKSAGLVVTNLTAVGFLLLGFGLEAMLIAYAVGFAATFVLLYFVSVSVCGPISLLPARPTRRELSILLPFAGLVLAANLTVIARDQADKLILAGLSSAAEVGYFTIGQRLSSLVMQTAAVTYPPLIAAFSALHSRDDRPGIESLYARASAGLTLSAGLAAFLVCSLHTQLFVLWLGQDQPAAHAYLALHMIGVTSAIAFGGGAVVLARGVGRPGFETQYALLALALTLASKPILIVIAGPLGAVASSAMSWALAAVFLLVYVHRRLNLPPTAIRRSLAVCTLTVLAGGLGWRVAGSFPVPSSRLQAGLVLCAAAPALTAIYAGTLAGLGILPLRFFPNPFKEL